MIGIKCPVCGGVFYVNEIHRKLFCPYCSEVLEINVSPSLKKEGKGD